MSNNATFIVENSLKNIKKLVVEVIENSDTIVDSFQLVQGTLENTEKENRKLTLEIDGLKQDKIMLEKTIEDNKLMVEMYNKRSKELDERVKSFEQSNQKLESERKDLLKQLYAFAVSFGSACTSLENKPSHVLTAMGLNDAELKSCIRFSFGKYTTDVEIESLIQAIKKIYQNE